MIGMVRFVFGAGIAEAILGDDGRWSCPAVPCLPWGPVAAPAPTLPLRDAPMETEEAVKRIREALRERSGKPWSVARLRGTASCWLRITAPPARRVAGMMTPGDRAELGVLLGLDRECSPTGESVPGQDDYHREYVDRAEGRTPSVLGEADWS